MLRWTIGFLLISYAPIGHAENFNLAKLVRETGADETPVTRSSGVELYFSESHLGLGYRYTSAYYHTLGIDCGLGYENGTDTGFAMVDPSLTFGLTHKIFLLGGINYAVPFTKQIKSTQIDSDWGYQVGAGTRIGESWVFQALYRQVNFKTNQLMGGLEPDTVDNSGLLIRGSYSLE